MKPKPLAEGMRWLGQAEQDLSGGLPADAFGVEDSRRALSEAEGIITFVRDRMASAGAEEGRGD